MGSYAIVACTPIPMAVPTGADEPYPPEQWDFLVPGAVPVRVMWPVGWPNDDHKELVLSCGSGDTMFVSVAARIPWVTLPRNTVETVEVQ